MPFTSIVWDLDDDPNGNVQHCAEHGITTQEVEEVLQNPTDVDISRWYLAKLSMDATL